MRPEYEQIKDSPSHSFIAKKVVRSHRPNLSDAWHYHPEIEICYTKKSNGKRFIGNDITNYIEGDLVMIGANVPHGFTTNENTEQYVIQFNMNFLGVDFFDKPEFKDIRKLIYLSKQGLSFKQDTILQVEPIIYALQEEKGCKKIIYLLELLNTLSKPQKSIPICSDNYSLNFEVIQLEKLKKVYQYILNNYQNQIYIKEVADLVSLSESAFYKFIIRNTNKNFTQIVNEFRINHAMKLLVNSDLTISEICYKSGFNNLSYFNRKFKEYKKVTPSEFRRCER